MTGSAIRKMRERLGLTPAQLGSILVVSETTVTRWELGSATPDPLKRRILRRFARAAGHADALLPVLREEGPTRALSYLLAAAAVHEPMSDERRKKARKRGEKQRGRRSDWARWRKDFSDHLLQVHKAQTVVHPECMGEGCDGCYGEGYGLLVTHLTKRCGNDCLIPARVDERLH